MTVWRLRDAGCAVSGVPWRALLGVSGFQLEASGPEGHAASLSTAYASKSHRHGPPDRNATTESHRAPCSLSLTSGGARERMYLDAFAYGMR
jgi:hypothetical protein